MESTLYELCDCLLRHRAREREWRGAYLCPACLLAPGRSPEAVFPMAVAYLRSGDERFLRAAIRSGDLFVRRQAEDGSWLSHPAGTWRGTTVFALIALANSCLALRDAVSKERLDDWKESVRKAAGWVRENVTETFANINYAVSSSLACELAARVGEDSSLSDSAREFARSFERNLDEDGFITGEGKTRPPAATREPVDLGYNLDMSLGAMAVYLRLAPDASLTEKFVRSLLAHARFIYPDGSVDNSWGARSYKWCMFGSKTAHGSQMAFYVAREFSPVFERAWRLITRFLKECMRDGMVAVSPHQARSGKVLCIHPTFNRADAIANALLYGPEGEFDEAALPLEGEGARLHETLNVATVRTQKLCATVSGYGYSWSRDRMLPSAPCGGSMSYLWAEGWGPVQVGTQARYERIEPFNQPGLTCSYSPLTPRVVLGRLSNICEPFAEIDVGKGVIEARGKLRDERFGGGPGYEVRYAFGPGGVEKHIKVDADGAELVEPLVLPPGARVEIGGNGATVEAEGGRVRLSWSGVEASSEARVIYSPFPAVRATELRARLRGREASVSIELG